MADNPQENLNFQEQLNRAIQEQLQLSRLNNEEIREILDRTELTADARRRILQLTRDTNRELSKNASLVEGLNEEFRETKDINRDINKATQLRNSLIAEAGQARASGDRELSSALANQARTVQSTIGNLEQERNIAQEIDNSFGAMGKSLGFINKLTGGKIKGLDEVLSKSRQQVGTLKMQGNLQSGIKGAMQSTGILAKNFASNLLNGKNIFLLLLAAAIKGSDQINRFQKELGISYGNALALRNEFTLMAAKSSDLFVNSQKLQDAFFELSNQAGVFFDTSSRASETFLNLNKRLGISAGLAANLTTLTRLQGKDTEKITSDLFKGASAAGKLYGTTATAKQILESAASASKGLQAALAAAPGALVKAAAAAKAFGVELKDLEATQKSLLGFEQSISAELEAELLTGRQLNLEKARLAALNNDMATLGEELKNQQIDLASFGNMNFIQQEKIAEALGMSRDTLADSLLKQEIQNKTLDEIREKFGDQTYEQAKALSAQDKMNSLTEKLQATFADLGVVLAPILDLVMGLMQLISPIIQAIGFVIGGVGKLASMAAKSMNFGDFDISNITSVNDAVIDPSGNVISTAPDDYLIATKDPSSLANIGDSIIKESITSNNFSTTTNNVVEGGISDEQIRKLAFAINDKKVVFDSFSAASPQGIVNTERRRPSNLFF